MNWEMVNWVILGTAAVLGAALSLWIVALLPLPGRKAQATPLPENDANAPSVMLFQLDRLHDHDNCAGFDTSPGFETWEELRERLRPRFGDLPVTLVGIEDTMIFDAQDGSDAHLTLSPAGGATRLSLADSSTPDPINHHAALTRLNGLSSHLNRTLSCPYPIWQLDRLGKITWSNTAAGEFLERGGDAHALPLPEPGETSIERVPLRDPETALNMWYEVHTQHNADGYARYAAEITETVHAESARGEFIQTLTKTFANLTTGLVVFDANRKLMLFNPALVDLTGLPVDFLSAMPDLVGFFDRLRDARVMPEPRDYSNWRAQIQDILNSAETGVYQETWALPSNVTYRVTGRPHPDGAVAFLFEDISADVLLSQRYRSELEKRDAMIEAFPQAVAILAPDNTITLSNQAFRDMFGLDPDSQPGDIRLKEAIASRAPSLPHPDFWTRLGDLVSTLSAPSGITHPGSDPDAPELSAHLHRLPDRARMLIIDHQRSAKSRQVPDPRAVVG